MKGEGGERGGGGGRGEEKEEGKTEAIMFGCDRQCCSPGVQSLALFPSVSLALNRCSSLLGLSGGSCVRVSDRVPRELATRSASLLHESYFLTRD